MKLAERNSLFTQPLFVILILSYNSSSFHRASLLHNRSSKHTIDFSPTGRYLTSTVTGISNCIHYLKWFQFSSRLLLCNCDMLLRYQCFYYPAGIALLCNKVLPSSCMPLLHSSCVFLLLCIRFFFFWHSQTRELQNGNILEIALNSCGADVLLPSFVHFHDFHLHHCLQVCVCLLLFCALSIAFPLLLLYFWCE